MSKKTNDIPEKESPKFSKAQLANSQMFAEHSVVVQAVLEDNKYYTMEKAEEMVNEYLKRRI